MANVELLTQYYLAQAGSGHSAFYAGPIYQRGMGFGSYFSGVFRRLLPILRKGTTAVGREVINAGSNLINEVGHNVMSSVAKNLMHGEGYKPCPIRRKRHSAKATPTSNSKKRKVVKKNTKKNTKKKPKKKFRDIFSK